MARSGRMIKSLQKKTAGKQPVFMTTSGQKVLLVVVMISIGIASLLISKAATSTASIEPEAGTLSANATSQLSGVASGGGYVKFAQGSTTSYPGLHSEYPNAFIKPDGSVVKINGFNIRDPSSYGANTTFCKGTNFWTSIKNKGFNAVRLAVYWDNIESTKDQLDSAKIANLDAAITAAKDNGVYVILDAIHLTSGGVGHAPNWTDKTDSATIVNSGAVWYWTQLANRYKNDHNVIAYDLVNEAHVSSNSNNDLLTMYQSLISAVRAVDSEKIVIIEAMGGDHTWDNTNWGILTNRHNLVVSHHSYFAGGDNDGYGSSGWPAGNQVYYDTPTNYPLTATSATEIANHYQKMLDMLAPQQLPLFLGEFGIQTGSVVTNHDQWIEDNVTALNARNIPRTWWEGCVNSGFSLIDNSVTPRAWVPFTDMFTW